MSFISQISPLELVALSVGIALVISKGKTVNQLNEYGNLLLSVGSLILLFASQKEFSSNTESSST